MERVLVLWSSRENGEGFLDEVAGWCEGRRGDNLERLRKDTSGRGQGPQTRNFGVATRASCWFSFLSCCRDQIVFWCHLLHSLVYSFTQVNPDESKPITALISLPVVGDRGGHMVQFWLWQGKEQSAGGLLGKISQSLFCSGHCWWWCDVQNCCRHLAPQRMRPTCEVGQAKRENLGAAG